VIRIRRARPTDTEGIADVVTDVWEQGVLPDVCEAQIEADWCALWVATDDADRRHPADRRHSEEVVGFASAFSTVDPSDQGRWEVDLVAMRSDNQGQGLGTQLISHVCRAAKRNEVSLARALIRVENVASRRAFENVGFTTDGQVHQLVLWSPGRGDSVSPDESEVKRSASVFVGHVALLPVDTVMYRGLWIEDLTAVCAEAQRLALETAHDIVVREHRDNIGALIPVEEVSCLATDLRVKGVIHGEYTWFVKPRGKT
jgi:L-amino acid N-acyltransferase YncA